MMNHISLPRPADDQPLATKALLVRNAEFEAQIARFEANTAGVRRSRRELEERIYYCPGAPIHRVPIEVLGHIFGFLVTPATDAIFSASQVCRAWRQASMFPELWSNVVVSAEHRTAVYKTRLYLQRSGHVSLGVTFVQSAPHPWQWSAWDIVKTSAHRWSSLSLTFANCMIAAQQIRSLPVSPVLTQLSVTVRDQSTSTRHDGRFGFETESPWVRDTLCGSPLLRSLTLSTFVLPVPGPLFHRLTTLHIVDILMIKSPSYEPVPIQAGNILSLLIHCRSLEDFAFDAEATGTVYWFSSRSHWTNFSGPPVSLPRLRRLYLNCHYFTAGYILQGLRASGLEAATLRMRPRYDTSQDKNLEKVAMEFLVACPCLRSLHTLGYSGMGTVGALVKALRELETLHLEYPPNPDFVIRCLIAPELFGYFKEPTWLAPRLSKVIIEAQPYELLHDNLVMFVKSRYCHNFKYGTPSPIQTLLVNHRNMLEDVPAGEIVAFERRERFGGKTWQMHQKRVYTT